MKKLMLCMIVCLMTTSVSKQVRAGEGVSTVLSEAGLKNHITYIYSHIDFSNVECLPFEVFDKAYRGYLNLMNEGKLSGDKQVLTVCDMSKSSVEKRMWIIDLDKKKVLLNTLVAHGQGSGKEYASSFSNQNNTHKTSLGFYVTGDTYNGEHGTSLHLYGMDAGFNNAAYERGIVVHGADYVSSKFIENENCLGRSWGCPAVPSNLSNTVINTIKEGTCLFIYYPEKKYLANSLWLNKPIDHLPGGMFQNLKMPAIKEITVEYVSAIGKVDSVKTLHQ